jgi:hypothetical protein
MSPIVINPLTTLGVTVTQTSVVITYTPPTNTLGQDSFTYTVSDTTGQANDSSTGTNFINIVGISTPVLSSAVLSGGNVVLSGHGGAAGGTYDVLTATNAATPLTNWTDLGAFSFNGSGNFSNSIPVSTNPPNEFFRIRVP